MSKCKLNLIIDGFLLIITALLASGGFLVYYVLVPGHKAKMLYGFNVELTFMGIDRYHWAKIHLVLGFIFIGLLLLHIIFHWKMIVNLTCKYLTSRGGKVALTTLLIISGLLILAPFLITPQKNERSYIRQQHNKNAIPLEHSHQIDNKQPNQVVKPKPRKKTTIHQKHINTSGNITDHNNDWREKIKGNHTLEEACKIAGISSSVLCSKLGISKSFRNERMGKIKRDLKMEMTEVKDIMTSIKKNKKL